MFHQIQWYQKYLWYLEVSGEPQEEIYKTSCRFQSKDMSSSANNSPFEKQLQVPWSLIVGDEMIMQLF